METSVWVCWTMGAALNTGWFMVVIGNDDEYEDHSLPGSIRPPSLLGSWVPASSEFRPSTVESQRHNVDHHHGVAIQLRAECNIDQSNRSIVNPNIK